MIRKVLQILLLHQVEDWQALYEEKVDEARQRYVAQLKEQACEERVDDFVYKPTSFLDILQQVVWNRFQNAEQCADWLWYRFWQFLRWLRRSIEVIALIMCFYLTESNSNTPLEEWDLAMWIITILIIALASELLRYILALDSGDTDGCSQPQRQKDETSTENTTQSTAEVNMQQSPDEVGVKEDVAQPTVEASRRVTIVEERKVQVTEEGVRIGNKE